MIRSVARIALVSMVLTANVAVSGCSSSKAPGGTSPLSTATSDGGSSGVRAGEALPGRSSTTGDPRRSLPAVTPSRLGAVTYAPSSGAARAHLAPVLKASGGLISSPTVKTIKVSGHEVGGVGIYRTDPGLAASPRFQDQFVAQLVNAVTGPGPSPRFVRAQGRVMALSTGPSAVAGWFEGDRVVLLYRVGRTPELAALALAVRNGRQGR
jgi:hypothetical protein